MLLKILLLIIFPLASAIAQENVLTLQQFLEKVQKESPEIAGEKAGIDAAGARASGIRIPSPMAGFMQMSEGGNVRSGFEISQEVPFPTKITQGKKVRSLEHEAQKESSNYQTNVVLAEARDTYIRFWSAFERLQILKEKQQWLKHHLRLTRAATRSDSSAQIHLLEVESESDLIENEVIAFEAEVEESRNKLKMYVPSLEAKSLLPKEPSVPSLGVEKSNRGLAIAVKEKDLAAKEAQVGLSKQAYIPDLFLRLRYFNGNEMAPQSQELMVGVSLPFVFFWQPKAEVAEASAQRMKAEAELQKARIEFESRLASLVKKSDAISRQLTNLKEKLIPRAERRKRLATNLSARTMEGLDEHRSVTLGLLDLRMKVVDLRMEYESVFAEILKLTGVDLKVGVQ